MQVHEVLPVPLRMQAKEGRSHIVEVRQALENSYVESILLPLGHMIYGVPKQLRAIQGSPP